MGTKTGNTPTDEVATTEAPAESVTEAPKVGVRWDAKNHFEERRMRYSDWRLFGAPELDEEALKTTRSADTVWDQGNGWIVLRSDIPLTDDQVREWMSRESGKFTLIEV